MGNVYAAFDERLEREVALKVLNEEGDLTIQKKRLLREARLAAKLTHPNIATVFEVDEIDGCLCIVMELLEGSALRQIVLSRRVGIDEGITIARDIARALARAHTAGVIHRDIKPENVFVTTPSPDVILTKVLDFGLARQRPVDGAAAEPTFTASRGDLWGTPGYVSPEQAHGESVDLRTDIFSFGVVVYETFSGIKPFRGDNPVSILLATTRQQEVPIRELVPDLPVELADILARCMRKNRDERFADGTELSAAIESYVRAKPSGRSSTSLVGSTPRMRVMAPDDVGGVSSGALEANISRTIAGAPPALMSDGESVPLLGERRDQMRLLAAVGSGLALALILTLVVLAWTRSSPRARASTTPVPQSAAVIAQPLPFEPPTPTTAAAAAPAPTAPTGFEVIGDPPSEPAPHATAAARPPSSARPSAAPRKKPADCAEPFKVDAKGVRIPKLYCL
jgi:serine/threonine protein kinase